MSNFIHPSDAISNRIEGIHPPSNSQRKAAQLGLRNQTPNMNYNRINGVAQLSIADLPDVDDSWNHLREPAASHAHLIRNEVERVEKEKVDSATRKNLNKSRVEMSTQGYIQGRLKFPDGSIFEGGILNGLPHGKGNYYFVNGTIYTGQFFLGVPQGVGYYVDTHGNVYSGRFNRNCHI